MILARNEIIKERNVADSIINTLPGIFYIFSPEGRFLRWNNNFENLTGYRSEQIAEMHPIDFIRNEDRPLFRTSIDNVIMYGESKVQAGLLMAGAEPLPCYFTGIKIMYDSEPCVMGVGVDISDRVLSRQKLKETSQQLRELTAHLLGVREEERKRIGREIHDELGQKLTGIKMEMSWLNKRVADDNLLFKEKFSRIISMLDDGNQSIRRILSELRPSILDNHGLLEALNWQAKEFTLTTRIPVHIYTSQSQLLIPEHISTSLYRIFQEAFTNIARYSEAANVTISIDVDAEAIRCVINDDGIGFDLAVLSKKKSFGILGIKERIGTLKGTFSLLTSANEGTNIEITIPLTIE